MNEQERRSILTLCLMAAFADGAKDDAEHDQIRRIAENLGGEAGELPALYQDVLLQRIELEQACEPLQNAESRQLAYEMAVCLCEADGLRNQAERDFLGRLARALRLPQAPVAEVHQRADELAVVPASGPSSAVPASSGGPSDADELDRIILNYSILNGALELLPDSLATMAIIPLQMKMVYRVGKHYGHELDRGYVREFLATAGVGLTSQVLETYAKQLLRGVFGMVAGGLGKMVAGQATSSAMSFATTYALGHAARQYYQGGRQFSAVQLRTTFNSLLGEAKAVQARYLPEMQQRSQTINVRELLPLVTQS